VTVPLVLEPERLNQDGQRMNVIGRLKPGVSIAQAQADVASASVSVSVSLEPMRAASLPHERKFVLWLMLGVVAFVLLIATASVANLLRLRSEAGYQLRVSPSPRFPVE
jgi:putative ABC transport system permease protein